MQNQNSAGSKTLNLQAAAVGGLIDTGADATCISPAVAKHVGLKPMGKIHTVGVTGASAMNQYKVDLLLQFGPSTIAMPNLLVGEFTIPSTNFEVLIGRDIICQGVLTMDFSGRFSFLV